MSTTILVADDGVQLQNDGLATVGRISIAKDHHILAARLLKEIQRFDHHPDLL